MKLTPSCRIRTPLCGFLLGQERDFPNDSGMQGKYKMVLIWRLLMFNLFCGPVRHRHRVQRGHVLDVRLRHRHGGLAPRHALLRTRRCELLKMYDYSLLVIETFLFNFDFQFFFSPPIMAYGSGEAFLKFFLQVRRIASICMWHGDRCDRLCRQWLIT